VQVTVGGDPSRHRPRAQNGRMPAETAAEHDPFVRGPRLAGAQTCAPSTWAAPRDALVAFTGISGSGKSSLAFGTIYAEAQRRYFESGRAVRAGGCCLPAGACPRSTDITGLPPAVALQQPSRVGPRPGRRSGTVDDRCRTCFGCSSPARAPSPKGFTERLDSDSFSPKHGHRPRGPGMSRPLVGSTGSPRRPLVPDPALTIREGAVASLAGRMAGAEPARHSHHSRLRHRQAVAPASRKKQRKLDPVHRRAAHRRDPSEPGPPVTRRLLLQRHLLQRRASRQAHAGQLARSADDAQTGAQVSSTAWACPVCDGSGLRPRGAGPSRFAGLQYRGARDGAAGRNSQRRCALPPPVPTSRARVRRHGVG